MNQPSEKDLELFLYGLTRGQGGEFLLDLIKKLDAEAIQALITRTAIAEAAGLAIAASDIAEESTEKIIKRNPNSEKLKKIAEDNYQTIMTLRKNGADSIIRIARATRDYE